MGKQKYVVEVSCRNSLCDRSFTIVCKNQKGWIENLSKLYDVFSAKKQAGEIDDFEINGIIKEG